MIYHWEFIHHLSQPAYKPCLKRHFLTKAFFDKGWHIGYVSHILACLWLCLNHGIIRHNYHRLTMAATLLLQYFSCLFWFEGITTMMFTKRFFRPDCLPVVGIAIAICSAVALSGCQSMTKQPSARAKPSVVTAPQPIAAGKSTLKCTGIYACEINRIGTLSVINQSTHTPSATLGNHS